jgi:NAD(P)H-hydrate epimerase
MNPHLTREQVRRIDQMAMDRYGLTGLVLMENAGRNAADIIDRAYQPAGSVIIFCGAGNNGGDGYVIARHLHNANWGVRVVAAGDRSKMTPDARANCAIIEAMDLDLLDAPDRERQRAAVESISPQDIVIDALLGTGFQGEVRSPTDALISGINKMPRRALVAIDVPSGLDSNTGTSSNATIKADLTITFVALKQGFAAAAPYVGRIEIADIGAPKELVDAVRNDGQ